MVQFVVLYRRMDICSSEQIGRAAARFAARTFGRRRQSELASLESRTLVNVLGNRTPGRLPAGRQQSKAGRGRSTDAGRPDGDGGGRGGAGDVPLKLPSAEVVVLAAGKRLFSAGARRRQRGGDDCRLAGTLMVQISRECQMIIRLMRITARTL